MAQTKPSGTNKSGTNIRFLSFSRQKILEILLQNPMGLREKTIAKLVELPRRTTYNNLMALQKLKLIQNIRPTWKLCHPVGESEKLAQTLINSKFEVHDFSFILRLIKKPSWWEARRNRIIKLKDYDFRHEAGLRNNPYEKLTKDYYLIELFANSIVVFLNRQYWGQDPYDCLIKASQDFLSILEHLEKQINFKFYENDVPQVSIRSQHYVRVSKSIADTCKKTGNMHEIYFNGKKQLVIDLSKPYGVEAIERDYSPEVIKRFDDHVVDIVKNNPDSLSNVDNRTKALEQQQIGTENVLERFKNEALVPFIEQYAKHSGVLDSINTTQIKQQETLEQQNKNLDKINSAIENLNQTIQSQNKPLKHQSDTKPLEKEKHPERLTELERRYGKHKS